MRESVAPSFAEHPLLIATATTVAVAIIARVLPIDYAATGVAVAFLAATGWLVLRHDTDLIRHCGLSLGGVLEPEALDARRIATSAAAALGWAIGVAALVFPLFTVGFRSYFHPAHPFVFRPPASWWSDAVGQLLVVALPEEAFYRGYLMTALDDRWGTRWTIAGARLGWAWLASSALFAIGHVLTEPDPARLAVFFPALLYGWLRARTGGIGAAASFHALCNLLSATLGRSYGLFDV